MTTAVNDYFAQNGNTPDNPNQWEVIHKYAKKNGAYIADFITLLSGGQNTQVLRNKFNKEATEERIVVLVASILRNWNNISSN